MSKKKSRKSAVDVKKILEPRDADAHYDIDGVSFSSDGVVISGDNQTTQGAPPPQKVFSKFRIRSSDSQKNLKSPSEHEVERKPQ